MSIKWKVLLYFSCFISVMIVILWLFQIVFLEPFYREIKTRTIETTAVEIKEYWNSESTLADVYTETESLARNNELHIRIVSSSGRIAVESVGMAYPIMPNISSENLQLIFLAADSNGGSVDVSFESDKPEVTNREFREQMTYALILDDSTMVLIQAVLTPVDGTVQTLSTQLVVITGILIVFAAILTALISRNVAKPIIEINDSAKELGKGNYNVAFQGTGYLEIMELSDTLNEARQELSKLDQFQKELIANVSHDLRTPLTMISGYGEMMRDLPNENNQTNLQIIIEEAKYLGELVSDLMDLSAIQNGVHTLSETVFDVTQLIQEIIGRYAHLIEREGYSLEFSPKTHVHVQADRIKIHQVIYNLINNAITYTDDSKKVVINQRVDHDTVTIEVQDFGPGIAAEEIPRIWNRYYRSETNHQRAKKGLGLGLSIVQGILKLHDVEYGVRSNRDEGTVFWFQLKLCEYTEKPASKNQEPR